MSAGLDASSAYALVFRYAVVMLATWIAGTVLLVVAFTAAPTVPPPVVTTEYLERLRAGWVWYAGGYGLLFVTDCCIAVLGVIVAACLPVEHRGFRIPALTILFALSGTLGALADVRMLGAAQLFRTGSPLLTPALAGGFLDELNAASNWLSVASFLTAGVGSWLIAMPALAAGFGRRWIAFTRIAALYQVVTGLLCAASFLTQQPVMSMVGVFAALIGLPLMTAAWLAWLLRELRGRAHALARAEVLA